MFVCKGQRNPKKRRKPLSLLILPARLSKRPPTHTPNQGKQAERHLTMPTAVAITETDNGPSTNTSLERFLVSLLTNVGISLVIMALFLLLRRLVPSFYYPRAKTRAGQGDAASHASSAAPVVSTHKGGGELAWLLSGSEEEGAQIEVEVGFLAKYWRGWVPGHGLDGASYLGFMRLLAVLAVCVLVPCACILVPVNVAGTNNDRPEGDPLRTNGLDVLATANVPPKSDSFWAHLLVTCLISLVCWIAIIYNYRRHLRDRIRSASPLLFYASSLCFLSSSALHAHAQ